MKLEDVRPGMKCFLCLAAYKLEFPKNPLPETMYGLGRVRQIEGDLIFIDFESGVEGGFFFRRLRFENE